MDESAEKRPDSPPIDYRSSQIGALNDDPAPEYECVPGDDADENMYGMADIPPVTPPPLQSIPSICNGSPGDQDEEKKIPMIPLHKEVTVLDIGDGTTEDSPHPNAPSNCFTRAIDQIDQLISRYCRKHKIYILRVIYAILLIAYITYFTVALVKDFNRATALFIMTAFAVTCVAYRFITHIWGKSIKDAVVHPFVKFFRRHWRILKWVVYITLVVILIAFAGGMGVFHSIAKNPKQLTSAFGTVAFILISLLCSKRPGWVQWKSVFWGIGLQFLLGIIILRTTAGFESFKWLGGEVSTFLGYSDVGAEFVFSRPLDVHFFVFKVLPTIIFFSFIMAILYYIGVMQSITQGFASIMQYTMGTSGAESLCAAANVFVGMTTAPLVVKPYLKDMTASEIHAVLTSGYATIAGSVLGAYISFGISASHLLSASIISAPAALAVSKIFYPEDGRPKTLTNKTIYVPKSTEKNVVEAAANGAADGMKICANITAQLIAIISTLAFVNAFLSWIGGMVDHPDLSFQLICRYLLYPVAWLMGVDSEDCSNVAELIGIKTFLNEFVAYRQLADYINNRELGVGPTISVRSEVITTYALCGFSNLGGIGIFIAVFGPLIPERRAEIALLTIRSLLAGSVACLLTACVAGVLYNDAGERFFDSDPGQAVVTLSYT
ncbi:solute carrier family 28 member 3-like [Glandiceps talaboti]